MSTSIFKGAKAFSFLTSQGEVGYVWAENSYDERDGPETATWDVMAIGTRDKIVERIFKVAANIPGGSTLVRHHSSAAFIRAMLGQLAKPQQLFDTRVELTNAKHSSDDNACVRDTNRSVVIDLLNKYGMTRALGMLGASCDTGGSDLILDLTSHLSFVEELTSQAVDANGSARKNARIQPWRLMPSMPMGYGNGPTSPALTSHQKQGADLQIFKASMPGGGYKSDKLFACVVDSKVIAFGERWEIHRSLICIAGEAQQTSPGYYKALLQAYDDACSNPVDLPAQTKFSFNVVGAEDYYRNTVHAMSAIAGGLDVDQFEISFEKLGQVYAQLSEYDGKNYSFNLLHMLADDSKVVIQLPEQQIEAQCPVGLFVDRPRG